MNLFQLLYLVDAYNIGKKCGIFSRVYLYEREGTSLCEDKYSTRRKDLYFKRLYVYLG